MTTRDEEDDGTSVAFCGEVIRDVWLFLDDEMDPERRAVVEQHLVDCPPCLDETDVGHRLKSLLHRKCGGDVAPPTLRASLILALKSSDH